MPPKPPRRRSCYPPCPTRRSPLLLGSTMRRREFIRLLGGAAATWPLSVRAQQGERMRRVGVLMTTAADDPQSQARNAALLQGLVQLGWNVARNLRIDYRWSVGSADNTRKDAAELVAL